VLSSAECLQTLPNSMEAARFFAPGDLRVETLHVAPPQQDELLMRVEVALTCGTDLKCFKRGHPVLLGALPSLFGHEGAGTVVAIGKNVSHFKPGDRVVAANSAPCGQCFFCEHQQPNLCEQLVLLNGTYAQYITLPVPIVARNTYQIPESLSFEKAAFVEPLAVALRGIVETSPLLTERYQNRRALSPADYQPTLALLGIGPIGLLMAKVASLMGVRVTAIGRSPLKRALAKAFAGVETTIAIDATSPLLEEMDAIRKTYTPDGRGFDVVIEAIGLPEMWQAALRLVRRGGTVNLFGGCPGDSTVQLDTKRLHYDEITLKSLFHHTPFYIQEALRLLSEPDPAHRIDPTPLITTRLPLTKVNDALQMMSAGEAVKVALFPHQC
jgi:L-iditol 2-dehydrogenase